MSQIDALNTIPEEYELNLAITESETEYISDKQLIDAREALSQLRKKHFE